MCLKISRGGISAVLGDARAARAAGSDVYLASTFDGPLGIAAAVHTAAALRITPPVRARDRSRPARRSRDGGSIAVPSASGAGMT